LSEAEKKRKYGTPVKEKEQHQKKDTGAEAGKRNSP
jgi:hypothetical protein